MELVAGYDKELDCFYLPSRSVSDKHYMIFYSTTSLKWWCDCLGFYYSDYTYCRHCDLIQYYIGYKRFLIINFEPENALMDYNVILELENKKRETQKKKKEEELLNIVT